MARARLQMPRRSFLGPMLAIAAVAGTLTVAPNPARAQSAGAESEDPGFCYSGWSRTVAPYWDVGVILVVNICGDGRVALDWFNVPSAPPRVTQ